MKALKLVLIITIVYVFGGKNLYSQTMDWDTTYMTSVLYDDFSTNQLDLNKWSVEDNSYTANGVIIDSSATVSVNSGNLKLSIISCIDCSRAGETRNLAGGEIISKESLQYGMIECSAKIDWSHASMPIFSFIGGNENDCANGNYYASEVDIFRVAHSLLVTVFLQHRIYHHHPDNDCKIDFTSVNMDYENIDPYLNDFFNYYHTYKCVWTPNYIRYYIDGDLKHEVTNTGAKCPICNQNWFPTYSSQVHLCNKVGGNMYYTYYTSTYFDWVRVKEFFETPEITCPNLVCSTETATLDVDSRASDITWSLSPSYLFSGAISGTGKTASITAASNVGAQGKITYSFQMPSGETFTSEKTFWVGKPATPLTSPSGYPTLELSLGTLQPISLFKTPGFTGGTINWWSTGSIEPVGSTSNPTCTFEAVDLGTGNFYVTVTNTCNLTSPIGGGTVNVVSGGGGQMRLVLTPNPTTNVTTISIESETEFNSFDETAGWDLEVYDQGQLLKEKKNSLKGKSATIQTAGWKEGIYAIRVKYKDQILLEKLIVQK